MLPPPPPPPMRERPKQIRIFCLTCQLELRFTAKGWVHTAPPEDGHKPVPVQHI